MPKPNKEIKQLLINDFGYEPVELESYTGQLRALKESFNTLQIEAVSYTHLTLPTTPYV